MKLVVAIIRPEKYSAVQAALADLGLSQLTLTDVRGQGHEQGHALIYRNTTFQDTRLKRLKLEIAVDDDAVDSVIQAIQGCAKTGQVGDGVILVAPLEEFIRIRTGKCLKKLESQVGLAKPAHPPANRVKQAIAAASGRQRQ